MSAEPTPDRRFFSAHATGRSAGEAARGALVRLGDLEEANFGIVYVTDVIAGDAQAVIDILKAGTGIETWVGAAGFGICADDQEFFDEPAVAILAGWLPADDFRVLDGADGMLDAATARWAATRLMVTGLVHADPAKPGAVEALEELAEKTGGFLIGGLSSSRAEAANVAGAVVEAPLSGALFGDRVQLLSGLTQGCTPIGPVRTVTAARENLVVTLDGEPAVAALKADIEDLGRQLAGRESRGGLHVALPVEGSDTGDYLVRNLLGVDEESGIVGVGALVEPDDKLMFVWRDEISAKTDLDRMLERLKARGAENARGAVYVSCVARGPNTFGPGAIELKAIREALGPIPLVGFYADGEISHNRLYGYTGVLTLFM